MNNVDIYTRLHLYAWYILLNSFGIWIPAFEFISILWKFFLQCPILSRVVSLSWIIWPTKRNLIGQRVDCCHSGSVGYPWQLERSCLSFYSWTVVSEIIISVVATWFCDSTFLFLDTKIINLRNFIVNLKIQILMAFLFPYLSWVDVELHHRNVSMLPDFNTLVSTVAVVESN